MHRTLTLSALCLTTLVSGYFFAKGMVTLESLPSQSYIFGITRVIQTSPEHTLHQLIFGTVLCLSLVFFIHTLFKKS